MADSIKVAVRIRPLVPSETDRGCQQCIETVRESQQVIVSGDRQFSFNYVYGQESNQQDVYETAVKNLVFKLFKGMYFDEQSAEMVDIS